MLGNVAGNVSRRRKEITTKEGAGEDEMSSRKEGLPGKLVKGTTNLCLSYIDVYCFCCSV